MLTISQLAAFAGVTVRAVRHYHAKGLLPEPVRDASGYRRYDATAVVELIRIRTLAQAGVPLAQVGELLRAGDREFVAALKDIDARLLAEIRQRQRHRRQLARLASGGDNLALPPEVIDYLQRLRQLEFSQRWIEIERDSWTMIAAQFPERVSDFMADKRAQLEDPETLELLRALEKAIDWEADDPRLPSLADQLTALLDRAMAAHDPAGDPELPEGFVELLDSSFYDAVPAARRLVELLEERGWSGWTELKPAEPGGMDAAISGMDAAISGAKELAAERVDLRAPESVANEGSPDAAVHRIELAAERGDVDPLRRRADRGDRIAVDQLIEPATERDDHT